MCDIKNVIVCKASNEPQNRKLKIMLYAYIQNLTKTCMPDYARAIKKHDDTTYWSDEESVDIRPMHNTSSKKNTAK